MSPSAFSVWSILKIYKEEVAARCAAERIIQVLERTTPPPNKSNYGRAILSSPGADPAFLFPSRRAPRVHDGTRTRGRALAPKTSFYYREKHGRPGFRSPKFFPWENPGCPRPRTFRVSDFEPGCSEPKTSVANVNGLAAALQPPPIARRTRCLPVHRASPAGNSRAAARSANLDSANLDSHGIKLLAVVGNAHGRRPRRHAFRNPHVNLPNAAQARRQAAEQRLGRHASDANLGQPVSVIQGRAGERRGETEGGPAIGVIEKEAFGGAE